MDKAIVITQNLISRLQNLTAEEKATLFETLICEVVLKTERKQKLSPIQELNYMILKDNVTRESERYRKLTANAWFLNTQFEN